MEGIISFLDRKKSSGRISSRGRDREFDFKEMPVDQICLLELGVTVELSETGGNKVKIIKVVKSIPYQFLSIPMKQGKVVSVADPPIFHHGGNAKQNELISGELRCSMEALTPLIVGNDFYKVGEIEGAKEGENEKVVLPAGWKIAPVSNKKNILEPLRHSKGNRAVMISGSGIKGTLRQSIGGLLAAPMERVAERSYSYRPNLDFGNRNAKFEGRPAIVRGRENGKLIVDILPAPRSADFNREKNGASKYPSPSYQKFDYIGGIDGTGKLAKAFNNRAKVYKEAFVKKGDLDRAISMTVSQNVLDHYYLTQEHLKDDTSGHLSKEHPLSNNSEFKKVKKDIENAKDSIERPDTLIYVEVELDKEGSPSRITSLGHHFRYRQRYADTIHTRHGREGIRAILRPTEDETPKGEGTHAAPQKLTGARLLFGYVSGDEDKNPGVEGIGNGDFERLAGRIACNMAVEVVEDKSEGERFLSEEKGFVVPLKILGTPRPSAVEFYLDQSRIGKRKDGGSLITYGDLPGEDPSGELRGRKFYVHQPQCNSDCFEESDRDKIASDQSCLARYISCPGTNFRFTIRFRDLRKWELGLLLLVLQPERIREILGEGAQDGEIKKYLLRLGKISKGKPLFAHKLGHGRPLGLGSVRFKVDEAFKLTNEAELKKVKWDGGLDEQMRKELREKIEPVIKENVALEWLRIHQYRDRPPADYPTGKRKGEVSIHEFHSDLRKTHAKNRRNNK